MSSTDRHSPEAPSRADQGVTILVIPEGGGESRNFRLSARDVRRLLRGAVVALVFMALLLGSWVYFAWQARQAAALRAEVQALQVDRERLGELASTLVEVEAAYSRILTLFTEATGGDPPASWIPGARPSPAGGGTASYGPGPDSWPLADRGFITQTLQEEGSAPLHPGIDIAVPEGTYIRAAAPGRVVEAAEDPVYGLFILLDHGGGYRTLYGHAADLLVRPGDSVEAGEVIGLAGSTGRSTAPHLHFEVLRDGQPVDPLQYVSQP